ncbi:hypothetical protein HMPREF1602_03602 [Escherichia coli 907889]|nr:hypothetical protein HMPREF1602_03602 [Escherichia coli 907889]
MHDLFIYKITKYQNHITQKRIQSEYMTVILFICRIKDRYNQVKWNE